MKKILIMAVLCTAFTIFAMEPRSASSSPILADENLEQFDYFKAAQELRDISSLSPAISSSPEPTETVIDFQNQFRQWINSANLNAFQEFLQEHYGTAEQYISNEIIEHARKKQAQVPSASPINAANLNEIIFLLDALNYGRQKNMGDMEKIWHHPTGTEEHDVPSPPSPTPEETERTNPFKENFFQQRSMLNIMLADLIEQQNVNEIWDIVSALTENNDCYLPDVISDKTVRAAQQKCEQEQTAVSTAIYDLIKDDGLSFDKSYGIDTTAQALEQAISKCMVSKLSQPAQDKSTRSALAILIENNNLEDLLLLLRTMETGEAHQFISTELLQTAQDMRDKLEKNKLYLLFDEKEGKQRLANARKICESLSHVLFQLDSNSAEPNESELKDCKKSPDARKKYTLDMVLSEEYRPIDGSFNDKASILNAILSGYLRQGNFEKVQDIIYKLDDNPAIDLGGIIGEKVVAEATKLRKSARRRKGACNYPTIKKTQLLLELNSEFSCEEFSSDKEDPEGALNTLESNQVKERIKSAFNRSTLEAIVGQPKASIIMQILAQQKQAKDQSRQGTALV